MQVVQVELFGQTAQNLRQGLHTLFKIFSPIRQFGHPTKYEHDEHEPLHGVQVVFTR